MKIKNILAWILALTLVLGLLAGCGSQQTADPSDDANATGNADATGGDAAGQIPEKYQNLAYFDTEHPERYGGELTYAMGVADAHLDINAAGASVGTTTWARYVYESALASGIDGKLYPLVCEYRYDEENQTWLELWVREGVTFHDGSLVEIEDVWASYNRNVKYQHILNGITNVEIKDGVLHIDYEPEVGCITALYWFGIADTHFGIMPKEICDQWSGFEDGVITDPKYVIGTGAYKFVANEYVPMEQYVLERHDAYIPVLDGDVLEDGMQNGRAAPRIAYLDRINIVVNTDSNTSMMQLLSNEYDVIYCEASIYQASLQPLGYQMYVDPTGKPFSDTVSLIFNMHSTETATGDGKASTSILANDVNLRKAICAAINIDEAMYGQYTDWWKDCSSPVDIEGYSNEALDNAEYRNLTGDIAEAKAYLAQSNYKGEEIILRRPSSTGHAICQVIQKNCKEAGINIVLDAAEISAYQADYRMGDSGWDMYLVMGSNTPIWPGFMSVTNYLAWGNEEAVDLRMQLFGNFNHTEESIAAWEAWSQLRADECSVFTLGKSLGDRYVQNPDLNPNYSFFTCYISAYWDNPEEHGA